MNRQFVGHVTQFEFGLQTWLEVSFRVVRRSDGDSRRSKFSVVSESTRVHLQVWGISGGGCTIVVCWMLH